MSWSPLPEMLWSLDHQVEAARKMAGWREFHRECGRKLIFFDHIVRQGGKYVATAFTLIGQPRRMSQKLAEGRGKTPIAAIADAYARCGRVATDAEPWLARLVDPPADDNFDDILGADAPLDMEDILG